MKRQIVCLLACILMALCYSACHDENATKTTLPPGTQISDARKYFESNIDIAGAAFNQDNPRVASARTVLWNEAYPYELFDGVQAIAVPMRFAEDLAIRSNITNRIISLSEFSRLLVYQDDDRAWHAEVVTLMPQPGYSGQNGAPFAGIALVDDWYGNNLKKFEYTPEGEQNLLVPDNGTDASPNGRTELYQLAVCTTVYGYNYPIDDPDNGETWTRTTCETYYVDGVGGGGFYGGAGQTSGGGGSTGTPSQKDPCAGSGNPARTEYNQPPAGGGGTGGGTGNTPKPDCTPQVIKPVTIVNDVKNPCVASVVEKFKASNLFVRYLFEQGHNGYEYDIQYDDAVLPDPTTIAETKATVRTSNYIKVNTRFNSTVVNGASKEYIYATLIHELFHGYSEIHIPGSTEASDHEEMASDPEVFYAMVNMLLELCPNLFPEQAEALTWEGLGKTNAWSTWKGDKSFVNITNLDFKYGAKGTKCN